MESNLTEPLIEKGEVFSSSLSKNFLLCNEEEVPGDNRSVLRTLIIHKEFKIKLKQIFNQEWKPTYFCIVITVFLFLIFGMFSPTQVLLMNFVGGIMLCFVVYAKYMFPVLYWVYREKQ